MSYTLENSLSLYRNTMELFPTPSLPIKIVLIIIGSCVLVEVALCWIGYPGAADYWTVDGDYLIYFYIK